jgi:hypothetical protein
MKFFLTLQGNNQSEEFEYPEDLGIIKEILSIIDIEIESKRRTRDIAKKIAEQSPSLVHK